MSAEVGGSSTAGAAYRATALDVRRLSLFLAVVDHGGFSRAAQAVHISQPALSQAIGELEAELGGPLFHRLPRRVALTQAGEALVGPARSVLRELDRARQVTGELTGLARGRLELSALRSLSADPLPALVGRFRRAHPAVTIRIASPDDPAELVEHVRSGVAEVGITDAGRATDGLVEVPLGRQRLVVVFPPGTPEPGAVNAEQLGRAPMIVTPRGTAGRDLLEGVMATAGVPITVAIETSQREAVLPLVMVGAGAAVLPEALARMAALAGAVVAGTDLPLWRDLVAVHRPGALTAPGAAFVAEAGGPEGDSGD